MQTGTRYLGAFLAAALAAGAIASIVQTQIVFTPVRA